MAGEALFKFSTSNTILVLSIMGILSALAKVRILLSSSTVLRFSIQRVSTGPSQTIQDQCLFFLSLHFFQIYENTPGTHSPVIVFITPYIYCPVIDLGFILVNLCGWLHYPKASVKVCIIVVFPEPTGPTTMNP